MAASSAGDRAPRKPLIVARTTLIGLREPKDLASTSRTPRTSKIARMGPPAIMPVPLDAGCIYTFEAPWLATMG